MVLLEDTGSGLLLFGLIFNLSIGFAIYGLRSRLRPGKSPLTLSQRWALTILAWLYIINGLLLLAKLAGSNTDILAPGIRYHVERFGNVINVLSFLPLLSFGLVFPRPVIPWNRLRKLLVGLALLWIPLLFLQSYLEHNDLGYLALEKNVMFYLYILVTFIPIFLWLPEYDRQTTPEMRMTITLLIWGYLLFHVTGGGANLHHQLGTRAPYSGFTVSSTLATVVFLLIGRSMYRRRGNWSSAEWLNLFLMIASLLVALFGSHVHYLQNTGIQVSRNPVLAIPFFFSDTGAWAIFRPLLFFYGLLRFQFLGTEVQAHEELRRTGALMGSVLAFIITVMVLGPLGDLPALGAGLGLALLVYPPSRRFTEKMLSRLLPLTARGEPPLSHRRMIYLMGLQTAVAEGEVGEPHDVRALRRLRRRLNVSTREHRILMAGFGPERPLMERDEIEEVYLFHVDGILLGHVVNEEMMTREKAEASMMATLFAVVKDFATDALKAGSEHLDSIEYGHTTLIIEIEEDLAMGVLLRGRESPQVRQGMREVLDRVQREYGDEIEALIEEDVHDEAIISRRLRGLAPLLVEFLEDG